MKHANNGHPESGAHAANGCTVELVTGARIAVDLTPIELLQKFDYIGDYLVELPVRETAKPDDFYRNRRWVNPAHVAAIYPLDADPDEYPVTIPLTPAEAAIT